MDAMANDKARTRISRVSDLGLIEISRERVREDLLRTLSDPCADCDGRGYTKSALTVMYDIFRDVRRLERAAGRQRVVIGAHPHVVELLHDVEHGELERIRRDRHCQVTMKADPLLPLEHYDIVVSEEG